VATIPVPGLPLDEPEMGPLPLNPPLTNPLPPSDAGSSSMLLPDWLAQLHPVSAPQRTAATRIASMRQPAVALTVAIAVLSFDEDRCMKAPLAGRPNATAYRCSLRCTLRIEVTPASEPGWSIRDERVGQRCAERPFRVRFAVGPDDRDGAV